MHHHRHRAPVDSDQPTWDRRLAVEKAYRTCNTDDCLHTHRSTVDNEPVLRQRSTTMDTDWLAVDSRQVGSTRSNQDTYHWSTVADSQGYSSSRDSKA